MNFKISSKPDLKLVEVTVDGLLTQEIRKEILVSSAGALNLAQYKRLLIDLVNTEFNDDEPVTGALTLITYMRDIGFPSQTRMAFIYKDAETHRKYFETVAQADGFQLRYFTSRDEATKWLSE